MALIKANLELDLKNIMDGGFPETIPEMASVWSVAINNYASLVVPPSASSAAAQSALQGILLGVDPNAQNGIALLTSGLTAYAAALGGGMAPAFIAVPPPVPVVLAPMVAAGLGGASGADCASIMADIVDLWFRTGTATPSGGGSPIFWS